MFWSTLDTSTTLPVLARKDYSHLDEHHGALICQPNDKRANRQPGLNRQNPDTPNTPPKSSKIARPKPEPCDSGEKTKSTYASVAASKIDTESKTRLATKPGSELKAGTYDELATSLSGAHISTQLPFTQYEPQLVKQTGLYPEDTQVRLEGK